MGEESIELLLPKTWRHESGNPAYYGLVVTNKAIYLTPMTGVSGMGLTDAEGAASIVGMALFAGRMVRDARKRKEEEELLQKVSLKDIKKHCVNKYKFDELTGGIVKKGLGEGAIIFKMPTGKKLFKTEKIKIGFPSKQLEEAEMVMTHHGFVRK